MRPECEGIACRESFTRLHSAGWTLSTRTAPSRHSRSKSSPPTCSSCCGCGSRSSGYALLQNLTAVGAQLTARLVLAATSVLAAVSTQRQLTLHPAALQVSVSADALPSSTSCDASMNELAPLPVSSAKFSKIAGFLKILPVAAGRWCSCFVAWRMRWTQT